MTSLDAKLASINNTQIKKLAAQVGIDNRLLAAVAAGKRDTRDLATWLQRRLCGELGIEYEPPSRRRSAPSTE
jgi:hypothetical protein